MTKIIFTLGIILTLILSLVPWQKTEAAYDKTNVITDANFRSVSMSAADINNFFVSQGSWLANYTIPEYVNVRYPTGQLQSSTISVRQVYDGPPLVAFYNKTVAQLIYDESVEHTINPRVIIATLQKESSSITTASMDPNDPYNFSYSWPVFYGFNDTMANCWLTGSGCNSSSFQQTASWYGGVGQQIAYSIGFFGGHYNVYASGGTINGHHWNDPFTISGQTFTCADISTRILYDYTPGDQTNFFNIYTGWFGEPNAAPPSVNDTAAYSGHTYQDSVTVSGSKTTDSHAWFQTTLLADAGTTSWQVTLSSPLGTSNYTIDYKDDGGNLINSKPIQLIHQKLADINNDGTVNIIDLSILASYWNKSNPSQPMADLNNDNVVNIVDLSILASNWGH